MKSWRWIAIGTVGMGLMGWTLSSRDSMAESEGSSSLAAFGEQLVQANGEAVSAQVLSGKMVGLYFSAQWCPPCRTFTPVLVETYEALQAAGKPFALVFVSHDRSEKAMMAYMRDYGMSWYAVPFEAAQRDALKAAHRVGGIPMLIILDEHGNVITREGRAQVASQGAAAFEVWSEAVPVAY